MDYILSQPNAAAAGGCLRWKLRVSALLLALVLSASTALAHDPFEITATLYVRSNHVELVAEMEFRPARILAGATGDESYAEVLGKVNARAGSCFTVMSGEQSLAPSSAGALSSVEDHVRLQLLYPRPAGASFQVEAPLLNELVADGPYGVSLTTLDTVNQKVVNQSVLFADSLASPPLTVLPAVPTNATADLPSAVSPPVAVVATPFTSGFPATPRVENQTNYRLVWWMLGGIILAITLWWSIRSNKHS